MFVLHYTAPSAPPVNVHSSTLTSSNIIIFWEPVECIHRNGDITGYIVKYAVKGSSERHNKTVSGGDNTQTTIGELEPLTEYEIAVAAVNDVGTGPFSVIQAKSTG